MPSLTNQMMEISEEDATEEDDDPSPKAQMKIPNPNLRVSSMNTFREGAETCRPLRESETCRPLRESQSTEQGGLISERRPEELVDEHLLLDRLNAELMPYEKTKYFESRVTPDTNVVTASISKESDVRFASDLIDSQDYSRRETNPFNRRHFSSNEEVVRNKTGLPEVQVYKDIITDLSEKLDKMKSNPMKIFDEKSIASNKISLEKHKIISEEELNDIENQLESSEGRLQ